MKYIKCNYRQCTAANQEQREADIERYRKEEMAAAAAAVPAASTTTTTPANAPAIASSSSNNSNAAQFREIHKNTWLKRLTADGKKLTVGPKVNLGK